MTTPVTEEEKRRIFATCTRFLNYDYPVRPAAELLQLSKLVDDSERSDFYGTGALIEDFEKDVATLLGKDAAVFMPSGTMAQLIALRIYCDRRKSKKFAMHKTSHLEVHEQQAYRELHGLQAEFLGDASRVLTANDFEHSSGSYAAALIELPQRELGGTLPAWDDVVKISQYCRSRDIAIHLDGARLWESAAHYQKSHREICDLFDSVYVSFYKGLGGVTGAMLLGSKDLIAEAKIWQRRHGGNLVKMYPYIVAARNGLKTRLPKMPLYHAKAKELSIALGKIQGIKVSPEVAHTNMMHLTFDCAPEKLDAAFLKIATEKKIALFQRLQKTESPNTCKAELTVGDAALDLETAQVVDLFKEALTT